MQLQASGGFTGFMWLLWRGGGGKLTGLVGLLPWYGSLSRNLSLLHMLSILREDRRGCLQEASRECIR